MSTNTSSPLPTVTPSLPSHHQITLTITTSHKPPRKQSDRRYLSRAHIPIRQLTTPPTTKHEHTNPDKDKPPTRNPTSTILSVPLCPSVLVLFLFPQEQLAHMQVAGKGLGLHPCHLGAKERGEHRMGVWGEIWGKRHLCQPRLLGFYFSFLSCFFSCARRTWRAGFGD